MKYFNLLFTAFISAFTLAHGQPTGITEGPVQFLDADNNGNLPFTARIAQTVDDANIEVDGPTGNSCALLVNSTNAITAPVKDYGAMLQATHGNNGTGSIEQEYYGAAGYALLDSDFPGTLGRVRHMIGVIGQVYLSDFFSFAGGTEHFVEFEGADKLMGGHFRVLMDNKNGALRQPIGTAEGINAQVVFDNNVPEPYDVGGKTEYAVGGNFQVRMARVRGKDLPATAEITNAAGLIGAIQTDAVAPGYSAGRIQNAYGLVGYIDDPQGAIDPNGERLALWTFGGENRLDDDTQINGTLDVNGWVNSKGGAITNNGTAWYTGAGDPNGQRPSATGALYSQVDAPADKSPLWVGTPIGWRRLALEE